MSQSIRNLSVSIIFLITLSLGQVSGYSITGGIALRSYETDPEERTSIIIPADGEKEFTFRKDLSVCFDNVIDKSKEAFGYICRLIINGTVPVDLILTNPVGGIPTIILVADFGKGSGMFPLEVSLYEPHEIKLHLRHTDNGLEVKANGKILGTIAAEGKPYHARLLFGANKEGLFSTTDSAPSIINNVRINEDGKRHSHIWHFTYSDKQEIPDSAGLAIAGIYNPAWIMEKHMKWKKETEIIFPGKVFLVSDYERGIWFVGAEELTSVQMPSMTIQKARFTHPIDTDNLTDNFIVLPDEKIAYYDFDSDSFVLSFFNEEKQDWEIPINRIRHSPYLHHNVFYNMTDSSIVQLFGYGFHSYSNDFHRYSLREARTERHELEEISPRYLASVGLRDTVAYIYGGKGNIGGSQELGAVITNDFYKMNICDYTVRKIWEKPAENTTLGSQNLIVSRDGASFRTLEYSPNMSCTSLRLTEFRTSDGKSTVLGDSIPYHFIDTESDVRLLNDDLNSMMYAVTVHKDGTDYIASIWSIKSPVLKREVLTDKKESGISWPATIAITLALALFFIMFLLFKRQKTDIKAVEKEDAPESDKTDYTPVIPSPGIYLLGGFRIIDSSYQDISSSFTPQLRQLLCVLILFSEDRGGISSGELKDTIWFGKSDESYVNSRGVQVRRLRLLLEKVSTDIHIQLENGIWRIDCPDDMCDLIKNGHLLKSVLQKISARSYSPDSRNIRKMISLANSGTLLPDLTAEWMDPFKESYDSDILSVLCYLRDIEQIQDSPDLLVELTDAILLFDSLEEKTMKAKCKALASMKKFGQAREIFYRFVKEYKLLLGEDYPESFQDFIK